MLNLRQILGGSPGRWFVSTRGISTGLALALALSYTKFLGVDKRSILAFIMVSAVILAFVFTSGISLALRNQRPKEIEDSELFGYLFLILIAGLTAATMNCALLAFYSYLKTGLPGTIYVVCFIYSFFACLHMGCQDALIAKGKLKIATFFDFITVLIQITTLTFFLNIQQTSLFVSVLIAFIFSYALISFAAAAILLTSMHLDAKLLSKGIKSILHKSRKQHLFGIANSLVDRIDRFVIGLLMPISFLAKYALLSSVISFARFFPDAIAKLNLLKHHEGEFKAVTPFGRGNLALLFLASIILVLSTQAFINLVFGQAWLLPLSVGFLLIFQEILRSSYQLKAMKLIALGGKSEVSKISLLLIVLVVVLIVIGTLLFGIWGSPIAMALAYLILILQINTKTKKFLNAK